MLPLKATHWYLTWSTPRFITCAGRPLTGILLSLATWSYIIFYLISIWSTSAPIMVNTRGYVPASSQVITQLPNIYWKTDFVHLGNAGGKTALTSVFNCSIQAPPSACHLTPFCYVSVHISLPLCRKHVWGCCVATIHSWLSRHSAWRPTYLSLLCLL